MNSSFFYFIMAEETLLVICPAGVKVQRVRPAKSGLVQKVQRGRQAPLNNEGRQYK